jgi:plastocyanin
MLSKIKNQHLLRMTSVIVAMAIVFSACSPAVPAAPVTAQNKAPAPVSQLINPPLASSAPSIPLTGGSSGDPATTLSQQDEQRLNDIDSARLSGIAGEYQARAASHQTFTVLVGADDTSVGANLEAYFPATIHIHVGDTVNWKLNSKELHNVAFLAGTKTPDFVVPVPGGHPGEMMLNPQAAFPIAPKDGMYDGSTFASSGVMGLAQGQLQEFNLAFTKPGTYNYVCILHNDEKMLGTVVVEDPTASIPSPADVQAQGQKEMTALLTQAPIVARAAEAAVKPAVKNADGTMTHYITMGYSQGQIDLEFYFPSKLTVHSGDTVVWAPAPTDLAPHTVTFLNGQPDPDAVLPKPQPNGPPLLEFNPAVALPINADKPLTNQGVYNSGLIDPKAPGPKSFTLKIGDISGDISYICSLHDDDGMKGTLTVMK